jgi:hypothetical protein
MDNDDLKNRLEFLFSESASGLEVEESKNGSLLKEIVTLLLGDEPDSGSIAAEPTLEAATPTSLAGPEMEQERDTKEVAGEPAETGIPAGEMHMLDTLTTINVAEEVVT